MSKVCARVCACISAPVLARRSGLPAVLIRFEFLFVCVCFVCVCVCVRVCVCVCVCVTGAQAAREGRVVACCARRRRWHDPDHLAASAEIGCAGTKVLQSRTGVGRTRMEFRVELRKLRQLARRVLTPQRVGPLERGTFRERRGERRLRCAG
jgi:hypothetical protein